MHHYFLEALVECSPSGDCGWQLSAEELAFVEHLVASAAAQQQPSGDAKRGSVPERGTPTPSLASQVTKQTEPQPPELKESTNNLSPTGTMQFALFTREQFLATLKEKGSKGKAGAGAASKGTAAGGRSATRAKADATSTPTQPAFDDSKAHWTLRILLDAEVAVSLWIFISALIIFKK